MTSAPRLLLCTDLDRTLLPNGAQPESPHARECFRALVAHGAIALAYVSGRDRGRVERAIANYGLPRPDFVVSDVGTSIYRVRDGGWQPDAGWQAEIARAWNGLTRERLHELLAGIMGPRLQEHTRQNTFKLSYYVPLHANRGRLEAAISQRLDARGVAASLVWSIDEPAGVGLLDILPRGASKLHAVEFVSHELGVALERTLFAGDSGNDLPVLASAVPAVLVANAMPAVAKEASAAAVRNGTEHALYLARGGLLGMNGNYAAGILEGVAHFHPELVALFAAYAGVPAPVMPP